MLEKRNALIACEIFAVEFSTLRTAASDRSVVHHRLGTGRPLLLSEFTGVLEGFYELIHKAPATGYSPAMQLVYLNQLHNPHLKAASPLTMSQTS